MTLIGNVGSRSDAVVDQRGLVTPWPDGWSVDWWVGADDGWHVPAQERESRMAQRLVDSAPVVETTMRVPGGDICHRAYAIAGAEEFVVVEITNRSPIPVAIAFVLRPYDSENLSAIEQVALRDESTVTVDGRVALVLPKPPSRTAQGVFVYPLPRTATIRVLLPLDVALAAPTVPTHVPTAEQVASGWQAHARRGMRFVLPDPRLQEAVDANRMSLLLAQRRADSSQQVARMRYGLDDERDSVTAAAVAREATEIARALRRKWKRPDPEACVDSEDLFAVAGLRAAVELLRTAGERRAAAQAAREADAVSSLISDRLAHGDVPDPDLTMQLADIELVRGDQHALDRLDSCLGAASATWSWCDARVPAQLLMFVRNLLVREVTTDGGAGLDLLTLVSQGWLGQGVEVHDAPTHHGLLSYAVRWHGERPALLWDRPAGSGDVTLRAPGLDPSWSTTAPSGEALLGPVEPARLPVGGLA